LRSADALDLREYLQDQSRAGQATATVARRLAAMRSYFRFLTTQGLDMSDKLQQLERPKPEVKLPQVLSQSQVVTLLSGLDTEHDLYLRDLAILELMYASGIRATELCTLKTQDVHLTVGALRVMGKGNKQRIVPIGKPAGTAVERYLSELRPTLLERGNADAESAEVVFLTVRGRPLERTALWMLVDRAATRSGLINDVHPHVLRHCFASHLVEGGADLRVVQELLGHSDIATTQVYTHVDRRRLKAVHKKHHPRG
jgi:integrase/recombinase XerD